MEEKLLEMIMQHEGFSGKPYNCPAGFLTIGYGHNLDANPISKNIGELILKEDIGNAIRDLYIIFPEFYRYNNHRRMALIDLMFNLGKPTFMKFKKFIKAVIQEDWQEAANQLIDSDWYKQVGTRSVKIVKLIKEG